MKETDLHTKRTGHTDFVDRTEEEAKPIDLEGPKAPAANPEEGGNSGSNEAQGFFPVQFKYLPCWIPYFMVHERKFNPEMKGFYLCIYLLIYIYFS